jgi:hypothetical protein
LEPRASDASAASAASVTSAVAFTGARAG